MAKTKQHKLLRGNLREKKYVVVNDEVEEPCLPKLGRKELLAIASIDDKHNKVEENENSSSSCDENSISSYLLVRSRKCKRKKVRPPSPDHQDNTRSMKGLTYKSGSHTTTTGGFYAALSNHGLRRPKTTSKNDKKRRNRSLSQSQNHLIIIDGIASSSQMCNGSGHGSDDGIAQIVPPVICRRTDSATAFAQVLMVGSLSVMEEVIGELNADDGALDQLQPTLNTDGDPPWNHEKIANENESMQGEVGRRKGKIVRHIAPSSSSSLVNSNEHIVRALYQALFKSSAPVKTIQTSRFRPSPGGSISNDDVGVEAVEAMEAMKPSNSITSRRSRAVSIDSRFDVTNWFY